MARPCFRHFFIIRVKLPAAHVNKTSNLQHSVHYGFYYEVYSADGYRVPSAAGVITVGAEQGDAHLQPLLMRDPIGISRSRIPIRFYFVEGERKRQRPTIIHRYEYTLKLEL